MSIYINPEEFGLQVVAEIDYSDGDYMFDYRVVWVSENGKLYTGRDMGCSCPSPFEDYHKLEDLDELTDMLPIRAEIREDGDAHNTLEELQTFVAQVEAAFERMK